MAQADERLRREEHEEGTLPIDFGDQEIVLERTVQVDGAMIVSDEAGAVHRLADVLPHGRIGVDDAYTQARPTFEREFATQQKLTGGSGQPGRTFTEAEPNYRAGFIAGRDLRYTDQTFEAIEAELRREYESSIADEQEGDTAGRKRPWERMRDEIQRGFQEARRTA